MSKEFIDRNTQFFDFTINSIVEDLKNGLEPQLSRIGPSLELEGKTYSLSIVLNKNLSKVSESQAVIYNSVKEEPDPKDEGWDSINKMLNEPEFSQRGFEIEK